MTTRPDRIDAETASEYLENGQAIVIDARPHHALAEAVDRIAGAVRVPPGEGAQTDGLLQALPRERLWIVYCDEPNQASSAEVARRARALGLNDASVLEGGLRAWREAGYPTERLRPLEPPPLP